MPYIIQSQNRRPLITLDSVELLSMDGEFLPVPNLGDHVFMTRADLS